MKRKTIALITVFAIVLSMVICMLPAVTLTAEATDALVEAVDEVAVEEKADEVTAKEAAAKVVETADEVIVEETTAEVVETTDEVTVEETADEVIVEETADEVIPEETADEIITEETAAEVEETADEAAAEATVEKAEKTADEVTSEGAVKAANFLGADGETIFSCPVGSSVTVDAIMEAYGISGDITSLVCDNNAVEIILNEDGTYEIKINEEFADAKLLFTVDGNEIEISVHDPDQVNTESSLKDIIAAINAGTDNTEPVEIQLTGNITLSGNGGITIGAGKKVTIDLNGYTLKNAVNENKASQVILNNGTLVIKDTSASQSGKIMNDFEAGTNAGDWWGTTQYNYASNVITNMGDLTVDSGTLEQTASGSICYAVDNNSNVRDASVTVNGGLLKNDATAVIRQFCQTGGKNAVTINGGKVEGYTGIWTQLPGSSKTTAPEVSLTINGGIIDGSDYYAFYDYSYGNAFNNVNYEINGGEILGPVFSYGANTVINGGEFSDYLYIYKNKGGQAYPAYDNTVEINGGCFSDDVYIYDYKGGTTPYYAEGVINGGAFKEYSDGTDYYDWCYITNNSGEILNNYDPETMEEYPYIFGIPVEVKFVNWDGEELFKDIMAKGHAITYPGATPTRPADDTYTYEFIGWDISLSNALEKDTVFTAQFKATPINPEPDPQPEPQPETQNNTRHKKAIVVISVGNEENSARYQGKIIGNEVRFNITDKNEIAKIISSSDSPAPVVVDCSSVGTAEIKKITLPGALIDAVNENSNSATAIEVNFKVGSVTLDKDTLASDTVANAESITVALEKTAVNKAKKAVQKEVGKQAKVIAGYDCSLTVNNIVKNVVKHTAVKKLDNGTALIGINGDQIHAKDFKVYAMDENGKLTSVDKKIVDDQIRFETDELQTYFFVK